MLGIESVSIPTQQVPCPLCGAGQYENVARTVDFCYETCANEFDYVKCSNCQHVYLLNRPLLSQLPVIYPDSYLANDYEGNLGGFISRLRDWFQKTKLKVLRRHLERGDLIAEIGPGAGAYLDLVRRHGDPTWEVLGVEFSAVAVAALEKRGLRAIQSRIEDVEWTERPVGAFVMNQLIEHVADPRLVLRKCFEALRPGGVMIIETPTLEAWDARLVPARYWAGWHAPRHWSIFDAETLSRTAKEEGFEVAEINYILSPFILLHNMQYLIRERLGMQRLGRIFDVTHIVPLLLASGIDQLALLFGRKSSNMQMVLRKPRLL